MKRSHRSVVTVLALTMIVSTLAAQGTPQRPAAPMAGDATAAQPGHHDWSWYSFENRPPFVGDLYEHEDTDDVIYVGSARFTAGDPPQVPEALRKPVDLDAFEPGYFLVHYEADLRPADKAALDELTGAVTRNDGSELSRWYVPNNTLVSWIEDADTWAAIEAADHVDWIGRYEPAYKLDPTIGSVALTSPHRVGRRAWQLNIDVVPGHSLTELEREMAALGVRVLETVDLRGRKTYDQRFLVVAASAGQITQIASVEGVRMIQESGDGLAAYDLSGGGKLQNRALAADDVSASPIVTSSTFPLWLTHNLQGQGQFVGVVDTSFDYNNNGTAGCNFGYPDTAINNYGMALPNLSRVLLGSVGPGGVNLKIPRADLLGGAALLASGPNLHGAGVAGAALADFYGNNDTKWWEHDPDQWDSWAPTNYSGLLGPGIAHEAQLYATPVLDANGNFRWESPGEFPTNMSITLNNMASAGVSTTAHSTGIVEASNTYTQTSVAHDTAGFDNPDMLQFMAAGNDGAGTNKLTSQATVKNGVAVGASDDVYKPEDRVTFSSTGPRFDGALKPDIMAPGSDTFGRAGGVQSLLILPDSNGGSSASCSYQYTSGTSFSAPTAAGAGALVHQYYQEGRYPGTNPLNDASAALIKATLVNAGHRLTGANLGNGNYPNDYQGWGEPNLSEVLDFGSGARRLIVADVPGSGGFTSSGNAPDNWSFDVSGSGEGLKVTLVWTDEPGSAGTAKKLINDLDLIVTAPGGATYRGNVINGSTGLSTTGGSADTLNNVENVLLSSPSTGTWTASVDPGTGNYSVGQGYALVITGSVSEGGGTPPPVADFSGSPTSGTSPLSVNFTDLSSGTVSSWSWTFGDGGTSTAQNPSHTYTAAGTYNVTLTATGPGGSDGETKNGYITVNAPPVAPVAEFSGSPTSGNTPLSVNFTDLSTGDITSWSWTFGDGGSSSAANPSHTYTAAGTYDVSLTVSGPGGSDGETKLGYITVGSPPAAPTANFSGSPTSGTAPLLVNFTDLSSGSITSWSWAFGDGGTSTAANPSHTYTAAGSYNVTLTVTGPGGSDGETKLGYVTVSDPPSGGGVYYITFTSNTTVPGLGTVRDEDVVTYDPSSGNWAWYFDGSDVGIGGTDINAMHVLDDGTLVMSFNSSAVSVPGLTGGPSGTTVEDSDLVLFAFTSSGSSTSGSFQFIFDGSDVGLTRNGEDIDGVYEFPDGGLAISTLGSAGVPGLSGVRDEDVMFFSATQFGSTTTGTWSLYFDGSDVGFSNSSGEDLAAVTFENGVDMLFSTVGSWSASGGAGADEDVGRFTGSFGASTSGSASLELDLSALGIDPAEDIDGICFR